MHKKQRKRKHLHARTDNSKSSNSHPNSGQRSPDEKSATSLLPIGIPAIAPELMPRKLLVMDLDETLVHSSTHSVLYSNQRVFPAYCTELPSSRHSVPVLYYIYRRPHVATFLKTISQWFDLAVYTASKRRYADPVIDDLVKLSGVEIPYEMRFYREDCVPMSVATDANLRPEQTMALQDPTSISAQQVLVGKYYAKDLKLAIRKWVQFRRAQEETKRHSNIYDRSYLTSLHSGSYYSNKQNKAQDVNENFVELMLKHAFILDNSPSSFNLQPDNGLPIKEWICDLEDTCLLDMLSVLDALRHVEDVRNILSCRSFSKVK